MPTFNLPPGCPSPEAAGIIIYGNEGMRAARRGDSPPCPYPAGTGAAIEWMRGYESAARVEPKVSREPLPSPPPTSAAEVSQDDERPSRSPFALFVSPDVLRRLREG